MLPAPVQDQRQGELEQVSLAIVLVGAANRAEEVPRVEAERPAPMGGAHDVPLQWWPKRNRRLMTTLPPQIHNGGGLSRPFAVPGVGCGEHVVWPQRHLAPRCPSPLEVALTRGDSTAAMRRRVRPQRGARMRSPRADARQGMPPSRADNGL